MERNKSENKCVKLEPMDNMIRLCRFAVYREF
jgi:hypothetical protein